MKIKFFYIILAVLLAGCQTQKSLQSDYKQVTTQKMQVIDNQQSNLTINAISKRDTRTNAFSSEVQNTDETFTENIVEFDTSKSDSTGKSPVKSIINRKKTTKTSTNRADSISIADHLEQLCTLNWESSQKITMLYDSITTLNEQIHATASTKPAIIFNWLIITIAAIFTALGAFFYLKYRPK
jgi:hypothetical protein